MNIICPLCDADQHQDECVQGIFGHKAQCRCRYCGAWFAVEQTEIDLPEDED